MSGIVGRLSRGADLAAQLAAFFNGETDPWARMPLECAPHTFGRGSTRAFAEYFHGTSQVAVNSVEDVCAWLRACECVADPALFFEPDHWQHPITFEHLRKGDCEDHALWAWRKLRELGVPALFLAGRWRERGHAWVVCHHRGTEHLLEATAKDDTILRPLSSTRLAYSPALGVDTDLRTWVYQGYPTFQPAPPPVRGGEP